MTVQATDEDIRERASIDRSMRFPVLFFFTSAAAWLFVATILGFFSALKLRVPGLWEECQFLGYGRVFPMHMIALVYGWALQAGIGVMLWLMARLTRRELKYGMGVVVIGHVWNALVAVAVICIWSGFGRSIPLLDFPGWMAPLFAMVYMAMVVWVIPMFKTRREASIYISEYYLVGAALWFPWVFITAGILISKEAAPTMAAGAGSWFVSNLIYFWMAPIALAVAYYIVPKIADRPIYSYGWAKMGFWILALFAGWTGFQRYYGGPYPAWIPAVSGAAVVFVLLAVVATISNLAMTLRGKTKLWEISPSLRFTAMGMFFFAVYACLSAVSIIPMVQPALQFSFFLSGLDVLAIYGFFSMTVFGAMYFIVPRITGCEWPSAASIRNHFWYSTYGIITLIVCLLIAGLAQGGNLSRPNIPFSTSFMNSTCWVVGACIAWLLIAVSNLWFFYQLALMFVGKGRKSEGPTLIHGGHDNAEGAAGTA
ncbi:MAG: cbb3-type cytochrome c oxidase subunit I [Verrucomicrobiales bacterium]|nr:cbb3-type cytochrome c oxidase subunit I [Verrucomicrobiales bacterium]